MEIFVGDEDVFGVGVEWWLGVIFDLFVEYFGGEKIFLWGGNEYGVEERCGFFFV